MNFQNDISFDAGGKVIVFGEHPSTVNENMLLRSLLYIGRAYERLVPPRSLYKKKIVSLPTPEFYTFYNGKEKWEKEKELRLSDAYIVKDADYLMRKGSEVVNMLLDEYDYETDIEVQREEAREEGREEGRKLGREEGREEERKEFLQKICSLIQKKLEKGKTISEIADDLEDTEENISHLIEQFHLGRKES